MSWRGFSSSLLIIFRPVSSAPALGWSIVLVDRNGAGITAGQGAFQGAANKDLQIFPDRLSGCSLTSAFYG